MLFSLIFSPKFKTALCNSPKIVERKKYIKNVQMKTLHQSYLNVHIFMFYSFGLVRAQIEILC